MSAASINPFWDREQLSTRPPRSDAAEHLRVRVNNIPLQGYSVEDGWFVFAVDPDVFAVGKNLIGVSVDGDGKAAERLSLEKLEVHVLFR